MNDVLIVIDMQNDFIKGCLGSLGAQLLVPKVREKIVRYSLESKPIFFTRDTHSEKYYDVSQESKYWPGMHCIRDTWGWQISENILSKSECAIFEETNIINKWTFGHTHWGRELSEFDFNSIEICGLHTDTSVISNALILRALYPYTEIFVDSDYCVGITREGHREALDVMQNCAIKVL